MAKLGGGSFASGATGAGVTQLVMNELKNIKDPAVLQWASAIVGAVAAKIVGGDTNTGASVAVSLIVYIHQNPLRAGIVKKLENYRYSSYCEYLGERKFVDVQLSLEMLGKKEWIKAHQQLVENKFQVEGRKKLSEEEIRQKILKVTDNIEPQSIVILEKTERDKVLQKLKKSGLSIREIERAIGISRGIVTKS